MGTRPASTHSLPRRPAERLSLEVPRLWHWGLAVDQGGERLPPHLGKHADPGGSRSLIQIQALDRTAPILPIRPGVPEKQTHDYVRHAPPHCSPPCRLPPARSPTFTSVKTLQTAIVLCIDGWNEGAHHFTWTKNADDIIAHDKPSHRKRLPTRATR